MKKLILLNLLILPSLLFFSCKEPEEKSVKTPDIEILDQMNVISFASVEGTQYINIFRKTFEDDAKILNIGQIIPSSETKNAYSFSDFLIVTKTKYSYCARYKTSSGYTYTGWSEWPQDEEKHEVEPATTSFSSDNDLMFAIDSTQNYLEYDEENFSLTFKGPEISAVIAFIQAVPSISLKTDSFSRVFSLSAFINTSESIETDTSIDLRTILTSDFLDTNVKINGILYEAVDETDKTTKKLYWSQVAPITVKNKEGEVLETIKVPFFTPKDDFHDLSDF